MSDRTVRQPYGYRTATTGISKYHFLRRPCGRRRANVSIALALPFKQSGHRYTFELHEGGISNQANENAARWFLQQHNTEPNALILQLDF